MHMHPDSFYYGIAKPDSFYYGLSPLHGTAVIPVLLAVLLAVLAAACAAGGLYLRRTGT